MGQSVNKSRETKKYRRILCIVFLFLCLCSLSIGVDDNVTCINLLKIEKQAWHTFIISRLPRTLAIIITATGLSIAGVIMQAIGRNQFVSPSTIGTTQAASLGVLISSIFLNVPSRNAQLVFAFLFSLLSTQFFIFILNKIKLKETYFVPMLGLMYGGIIASLTQMFAYQNNVLQILSSLNLGSFNRFTSFRLLWIVLIPVCFALVYATRFSIVSIGADFAKNLGINYNRTIFLGVTLVSLISASTFVTVGPIPFVGLIIPNLINQYFGSHLKNNMLNITLFGSSFVLFCDIISRLIIFPYEVAIGLTIGIIGGLIFMFIILRRSYYAI